MIEDNILNVIKRIKKGGLHYKKWTGWERCVLCGELILGGTYFFNRKTVHYHPCCLKAINNVIKWNGDIP